MPDEMNATVKVPQLTDAGTMPEKIYVTFTEAEHKKSLLETWRGYEKTAIAKELATFWFPEVIAKFREAIEAGATSLTFDLTQDED